MQFTLQRSECEKENGGLYRCDSFVLATNEGYSVDQLQPSVEKLPGVFTWISTDAQHGAVRILDGDLESSMRVARGWPGIRYVDYSGVACIADVSGCGPSALSGAVGLTISENTTSEDGALRARPADTITVEYKQPDGRVLTTSLVVQ